MIMGRLSLILLWVAVCYLPCLGQTESYSGEAPPSQVSTDDRYHPITGGQRMRWAVKGTIGMESLAAGLFSAGISTAQNHPEEYGPGWEGFGKRYGMRLTGIATGNLMEAGLGSLWGEDPRYFRSPDRRFRARVSNIL